MRLNYVKQAVLEDLDIENSALGIRVNNGRQNMMSECTVLGTRVEQGILVYYSRGYRRVRHDPRRDREGKYPRG